jgi:hypothetical protein
MKLDFRAGRALLRVADFTENRMSPRNLILRALPERFAVCRLKRDSALPDWALRGGFFSVTRTDDELSIVCAEENVPQEVRAERGWRCLMVLGPFAFSDIGVLSSLTEPLARAGISLFAISTFDTDYLLVKQENLEKARAALSAAGHQVHA